MNIINAILSAPCKYQQMIVIRANYNYNLPLRGISET